MNLRKVNSRKVLEAKRKNLVVQGKGNRPNATRSLTEEEEEKLFQSGTFGAANPVALQRTIWWILSLYFGFRAPDQSRKLCWGDVSLQKDPIQDGREMLVWLNDWGTKTRKGKRGKVAICLPSHQKHMLQTHIQG